MAEIDMTFEEFLIKNDLAGMIPQLRYQHEAQGYGLLNEIPALYGLWWCTPHFLENSFHPYPHPPIMAMIKNGFQNLFLKLTIAEKEQLNIAYNVHIESITRKPTCKRGKAITITEHNGKVRTFDYLIMAVDMSTQHKLIKDLRPDEREIFSDMVASTLATTLIESDALKTRPRSLPKNFGRSA
jgi:predicted NAD/FAD-binding protein